MKLITVKSASATALDGYTDFVLTVTDANDGTGGQFDIPFTYNADDTADIAQQVSAWTAAHPDFQVAPYAAPAPTSDDVWAEKDRRWALGFDYNFGDDRGTHRIGTTEKDMEDWSKVTALAQAAINLGQPTTPIGILTDTGPATVTAQEWQSIIIATAQFQQPIFQAAVTLSAMNPIPADYASDSHWTA